MNELERDPATLPVVNDDAAPLPSEAFDPSLVGMMLELTVEQRLEWLCSTLRAIQELRDGLRT